MLGNVRGNCDGQDVLSTFCLPELLVSPSARVILPDVYSIPFESRYHVFSPGPAQQPALLSSLCILSCSLL